MKNKISKKDAIWMLDFSTNYIWLKDKRCYNVSTERFIKQTKCGGSIGYVIDGKFCSNTKLRPHLVKYKQSELKIKRTKLYDILCPMVVCSGEIFEF